MVFATGSWPRRLFPMAMNPGTSLYEWSSIDAENSRSAVVSFRDSYEMMSASEEGC